MEATQASQASGSNAVGPSALATVDDWPFISHDATLSSTCNHHEKAGSSYQPASTWEAKGKLRMAPSIQNLLPLHNECTSSLTSSSLFQLASFSAMLAGKSYAQRLVC